MFTGITEGIGRIASARPNELVVSASQVLQEIEVGGSIAVNGVCLTVTSFNSRSFSVNIMPETLGRTNLELLGVGDEVNLERPLSLGKPLGGHLVQGHIDATGRVAAVRWDGEAMLIRFDAPTEVMHYVVEKGFIAVDGISLTVVDCSSNFFRVSVVGYTREHTNLGTRQVGDLVNLEVDIVAKYVEQVGRARSRGITAEFLQQHGFLVS